jgi:hypothetical protein
MQFYCNIPKIAKNWIKTKSYSYINLKIFQSPYQIWI